MKTRTPLTYHKCRRRRLATLRHPPLSVLSPEKEEYITTNQGPISSLNVRDCCFSQEEKKPEPKEAEKQEPAAASEEPMETDAAAGNSAPEVEMVD